ncbi:hypothetical protein PYK79_25635 [Streptomyces sp. ID05-04B]|uniref:hypothetical protein n=1 Tax=unclassified Streptomyces TaxID=2593676 RepID=UPI000D1A5247|nr:MULTISPECIES: hypothetical protein [unclassified Streptomyces]AVV44480.1 hypothetical protein C6376_26625 [Streptomyces sp. P3]MDX5566012.1 hypothetical protein [Streptomyces sp. ID05-04B]
MRGVLLGTVFGGLTAVVSVVAVGRAWASCDVGVNAGADLGTLLFLAPVVWLAAAAPWPVLRGTLGRTHPRAALVTGLLFTLWFTWFLVTWLGMPASYPDPVCPGNVPPWWPGFLPT